MLQPFAVTGNSVVVTGTTTSGATAIPGGGQQVQIQNAGAVDAFVKFNNSSTVTAVVPGAGVSSSRIPAGSTVVWTIPPGTTHLAAITVSSTAALYIERSSGV